MLSTISQGLPGKMVASILKALNNRTSMQLQKSVFSIVHLVAKQHQSGMFYVLCLGIFPLLDSFSRLKPCNIRQVSEIVFLFNFSNLIRDKSQEVNIYVEEAT